MSTREYAIERYHVNNESGRGSRLVDLGLWARQLGELVIGDNAEARAEFDALPKHGLVKAGRWADKWGPELCPKSEEAVEEVIDGTEESVEEPKMYDPMRGMFS